MNAVNTGQPMTVDELNVMRRFETEVIEARDRAAVIDCSNAYLGLAMAAEIVHAWIEGGWVDQ